MLLSYLKIAFRNFYRNKSVSFINVLGLSLGLGISMLILLFILDESRVDKHHKDGDLVYRIGLQFGDQYSASSAAPIAWGLKDNFPEIVQVTRLLKFPSMEKMLLRFERDGMPQSFFETRGYYIDSTFFELFDYEFVHGGPSISLRNPSSIILSQSLSEKLFGNENPVGNLITLVFTFGDADYTVSGVYHDKGHKSHIDARFFLSMQNNDIGNWVASQTNWINNNLFHTYIKANTPLDEGSFIAKANALYAEKGGEELRSQGMDKVLHIQSMPGIYLNSDLGYEIASNGNKTYLYIFGSIALFILLIACINFMNLATAKSAKRSKEVGIRKVIGASKNALIFQFLAESVALCLISLLIAILMVKYALPYFNAFSGKELVLADYPFLMVWMLILTLIAGLLAGTYPAFYLSSIKPISIFRGRIKGVFSAAFIRKGLVVFQFSISIVLIIMAVVIISQLNFVQKKNLGFEKDQQLVLPLPTVQAVDNYQILKDQLLNYDGFKSITGGTAYPGIHIMEDRLFYGEGKNPEDLVDVFCAHADNDYIETLGMKLLSGRSFRAEYANETGQIILNERAVKELGYDLEEAVGKLLYFDWQGQNFSHEIIGVMADFHFQSLHTEIKPFGLIKNTQNTYLIANVSAADLGNLLENTKQVWARINPDTPFDFSFIDQDFLKNYEKELRTGKIIIFFTILAIFIACLGLFGLAAFITEQRTKEIGVRKVLGASIFSVTRLVSKDFVKLVGLSILFGSPLAFYLANKWLQNFSYKISLSIWLFALAGLMVLLVAMLTVSYQAIKAALANPVNSLRTD
jgi:putative ABC transport system permease protein